VELVRNFLHIASISSCFMVVNVQNPWRSIKTYTLHQGPLFVLEKQLNKVVRMSKNDYTLLDLPR
jgi:hypothetical protein